MPRRRLTTASRPQTLATSAIALLATLTRSTAASTSAGRAHLLCAQAASLRPSSSTRSSARPATLKTGLGGTATLAAALAACHPTRAQSLVPIYTAPFNQLIRSVFRDARATHLESLVVHLQREQTELKGMIESLLRHHGVPKVAPVEDELEA